ncbi:putative Ig domain-containing protein [Streptomyces sp. NPDC051985]|uniref:putative Ig domain-containing protein n=1 Tax=Streptomyces sp. NPDC051985 TaxID=3155807 RepID=UPI0034490044
MRHALAALAAASVLVLSGASAQAGTPAADSPSAEPSCAQDVTAGHYTCFALKRTDVKEVKALAADATPDGYGPADLHSAYNLPDSDTAATIAIVDAFDDPTAESDLAAYRSQYGLPACTTDNGCFTKLNQNGQTSPPPSPDAGWAGEISLDLDMVSATCPSCHITLVESDDNTAENLFGAVKKATDLGIKYVSMSFGGPESGDESGYDTTYLQSSGVVYTASSGDSGYSAGPIYPSTSNRVVSVGGTSLTRASGTRGWTESVWGGTGDGTGSGCSSDESKPSWQGVVPDTVCGRRADTDVSAVADPATGVAVYQTYGGGGWAVYGGTSASAPIIAAVYALAGTPGADDQPASNPYTHNGGLNDVTSGDNGTCTPALLCTAATGWDGPTGLGTPDGLTAFKAGNRITVTGPGNQNGTAGTPVSLQIQATDSSPTATLAYAATGLPPGLTIDADTGLISGTPSAGGVGSVTVKVSDGTGATASTSFTWTVIGNGTGCFGQVLLNPGFEYGDAGWTASDGVVNADGTYAHGGSGYAWLDGYGTAHTATLSQQVAIPAKCRATLDYQLRISSYESAKSARDTLTVTADGHTLQAFSNTDQGTGYVERTVDLSAYAGKTVTLTWTGKENSSLATSFFVDDADLNLG